MKKEENKDELMELGILATPKTPFVMLKPNGKFMIMGRSIPEDGSLFYETIMDWIEEYEKIPASRTILTLELEFLNDISSKYLLRIIKILNRACSQFTVKWRYEANDEDMLELGQFMCSLSGSEFEYIMLK